MAIMTSISTPPPLSGLKRSTATFFARSSSSLPLQSLPSWSLDHSCSTFKLAAVQHPKSTKLIDDDPDTDEENHIHGIKRNREISPLAPSKRRCHYPTTMFPVFQQMNNSTRPKNDQSFTWCPYNDYSNPHSVVVSRGKQFDENNETGLLVSSEFLDKQKVLFRPPSLDPLCKSKKNSKSSPTSSRVKGFLDDNPCSESEKLFALNTTDDSGDSDDSFEIHYHF